MPSIENVAEIEQLAVTDENPDGAEAAEVGPGDPDLAEAIRAC